MTGRTPNRLAKARSRLIEAGTRTRAWMVQPARRIVVETLYVLLLVVVIWVWTSVKAANHRTDALAHHGLNAAVQARQQGVNIEGQRRQSIIDDCNDTNNRHKAAFKALGTQTQRHLEHARGRGQRTQIRNQRAGAALLLRAVLPYRDCRALAAHKVPGPRHAAKTRH